MSSADNIAQIDRLGLQINPQRRASDLQIELRQKIDHCSLDLVSGLGTVATPAQSRLMPSNPQFIHSMIHFITSLFSGKKEEEKEEPVQKSEDVQDSSDDETEESHWGWKDYCEVLIEDGFSEEGIYNSSLATLKTIYELVYVAKQSLAPSKDYVAFLKDTGQLELLREYCKIQNLNIEDYS